MGQKDIAEKNLENYNDVFADIINVLLMKGIQLIRPEELMAVREQTHYKTGNGELHEMERDVSKYWMKGKIRLSLYGLENQTRIDPDMPFRTIGYDGASYREQLLEDESDGKSIQKHSRRKRKRKRVPVVTIILYFGEKHWRYPNSIRDMVNIPPELEPYFNDYKIYVFEIAWLTEEQVQMFQSDFRIVADYFVQKRKNKDYIPSTQKIRHVDAVLKMLSVCSGDNRFCEAIVDKNQAEGKTVTTMCEVLDKIVAQGEARGEARGRETEIVRIIRSKLQKHMGISDIAEMLELEEDYVAEIVDLLTQNPEKTDVEIAGEYLCAHSGD